MDNITTTPNHVHPDVILLLFPAIVQVFAIILCGYFSGRLQFISSSHAKGIGKFASNFALPALIFRVLIKLNFVDINWNFLFAVLLAKAIIFIITLIFCLLITKPINFGLAGIMPIVCTQTNDVALGLPILQVLFPSFDHYIYLFAPISFVVLNPIGFILMEIHVHKSTGDQLSKLSLLGNVAKGVITNPLVIVTLLAIAFNFILKHYIPPIIDRFLETLANSFSAAALFFLGNNMVGKVMKIQGSSLYGLLLLVIVKLILSAFVMREVINTLVPDVSPSNISTSHSTFAFMYGGLPPAPTVFIYANSYGISSDLVACALVVLTFVSAPLMFVTSKVMMLTLLSHTDYMDIIESTTRSVCGLSLFCLFWIFVSFGLARRICRMPHRFTLCLFVCQFMANSAMLSSFLAGNNAPIWLRHVLFAFFFIGVSGARFWTVLLTSALLLLRKRGLCALLRWQWIFFIVGFAVPLLLTGCLLMAAAGQPVEDIDPAFHFGKVQEVISLGVLLICLPTTLTLLIVLHRSDAARGSSAQLVASASINSDDVNDDEHVTLLHNSDDENGYFNGSSQSASPIQNYDSNSFSVEKKGDVDSARQRWYAGRQCHSRYHSCSADQRRRCMRRLAVYRRCVLPSNVAEEEYNEPDQYQIGRHKLLLIFLIVSMTMGIFLCIWRLIKESLSGIYIELEFLDIVFNSGQGFLAFCVFGLDTNFISLSFKKRMRKLFFGDTEIHLPPLNRLKPEVLQIRAKFVKFHMKRCYKDIVGTRSFKRQTYENVFTGKDLVTWLEAAGLVSDRIEAVTYGEKLLLTRVFTHVTREQHFHDALYCYKFDPNLPRPRKDSDRSCCSEPSPQSLSVPDIEEIPVRMASSYPDRNCPSRQSLLSD